MFFLAGSFWERLIRWDQQTFTKLNGEWVNPVFDNVLPYVRSSSFWVPLYLFGLVFVILNFRVKGLWWVIFLIATVALTDMTGTYVFKNYFERLRPCQDPEFSSRVRLVINNCAGHFSFVSNHAANHMGIAVVFIITFRRLLGNWIWLALAWALLIMYAQVYVGVHYPLDVMGGALVGAGWGYLMATSFNKHFRFTNFGHQPKA